MSRPFKNQRLVLPILVLSVLWCAVAYAYQASSIPSSRLISPEELVKVLQSAKSDKPLVIQVGSHVLFSQAHVPGSEYIGPAAAEDGYSDCGSASRPSLETDSLSSIVAVVRGVIVPTSNRPTIHCRRWAFPT
jgi:hypothetical protein